VRACMCVCVCVVAERARERVRCLWKSCMDLLLPLEFLSWTCGVSAYSRLRHIYTLHGTHVIG
jgi:hypothetical protein